MINCLLIFFACLTSILIVHILSFIIKSFSNELNKNFKMLCATISICLMQFNFDLCMVLKICWLIWNALFHTFKFCRKSWGKLGYAWIWDAKLYKWVNLCSCSEHLFIRSSEKPVVTYFIKWKSVKTFSFALQSAFSSLNYLLLSCYRTKLYTLYVI